MRAAGEGMHGHIQATPEQIERAERESRERAEIKKYN
jgi:hypothetical protein